MSGIQFFLIPVQIVSSLVAIHYCTRNKEFSLAMMGIFANFFNNIFKYYITINFSNGINNKETLELLFINYFIRTISTNIVFIGTLSFNFRMCDHVVAGTFLTILNSVSNFGMQWTLSFVIFISNYLSFEN